MLFYDLSINFIMYLYSIFFNTLSSSLINFTYVILFLFVVISFIISIKLFVYYSLIAANIIFIYIFGFIVISLNFISSIISYGLLILSFYLYLFLSVYYSFLLVLFLIELFSSFFNSLTLTNRLSINIFVGSLLINLLSLLSSLIGVFILIVFFIYESFNLLFQSFIFMLLSFFYLSFSSFPSRHLYSFNHGFVLPFNYEFNYNYFGLLILSLFFHAALSLKFFILSVLIGVTIGTIKCYIYYRFSFIPPVYLDSLFDAILLIFTVFELTVSPLNYPILVAYRYIIIPFALGYFFSKNITFDYLSSFFNSVSLIHPYSIYHIYDSILLPIYLSFSSPSSSFSPSPSLLYCSYRFYFYFSYRSHTFLIW